MTTVAAALTGALALAACSSSGSTSPGHGTTTGADRTVAARTGSSAPTEVQLWEQSICNALDASRVAKAAGADVRPGAARKKVVSTVGTPSLDYCTVRLRDGSKATDVQFGVSALSWSATQWSDYRRSRLGGGAAKQDGFYGELEGRGEHAVLVERGIGGVRVLTRAGDRILAVRGDGGGTGLQTAQLIAAAKVAAPSARNATAWPATEQASCGEADAAVIAALGAPATVRRDTASGRELTCQWAVRDGHVSIRGDDGAANWPGVVRSMQRQSPDAQPVAGVGEAAVYTGARHGRPSTLRVATEHHLIHITGSGRHVDKQSLTGVGKAIAGSY